MHACGAKHVSKSKVLKTEGFGAVLEVEMSKSARRCGAKHISKSKVQKLTGPERNTFGRSDVVSRGGRKGLHTLPKVSKTWGFCRMSKNDGRRAAFVEEDPHKCISRGGFIRCRKSGH